MLGAGPSLDVSVIPSTVPDAPIVTYGHTNHAIQWSWYDPYDEGNAITGYNIYRTTDSYNYTLIASVADTVSNYSDTGLTNGNGYYYVIGAVNANGEGPRSAFGAMPKELVVNSL
eukprot:gene23483-29701_t